MDKALECEQRQFTEPVLLTLTLNTAVIEAIAFAWEHRSNCIPAPGWYQRLVTLAGIAEIVLLPHWEEEGALLNAVGAAGLNQLKISYKT